MRFPVALAVLALMIPFGADAQEAIATASSDDAGPPAAAERREGDQSAEDPGDWARRVLAGQPAPPDPQAPAQGCPIATDGKPHGEVWVGAGTRGYREIGGVVTQQIGKCASVTVAVSKTEGPRWSRR